MTQPILLGRDLVAGYDKGINILQGLSFSLEPAKLTLVIGPNGAGKSTLLKTLFGFVVASEGRIELNGSDVTNSAPDRMKHLGVSYVTQEINTFANLTVEENLQLGGWTIRRRPALLKERIDVVYETLPVLKKFNRKRAGDLSGGQGRLLAIARELITAPSLMLIDEPTVGLSPNIVDEVYEFLQKIKRESGTTILLVDQNVEDARRYADFIYLLNLGTVKAEGPSNAFDAARIARLFQQCLTGETDA